MLILILLIIGLMLLSTLTDKRFEEVLAPAVCGTMLVLYALAVFCQLALFQWLLLAAVAVGLAFVIVRVALGHGKALGLSLGRNFFTPGLVLFALLSAVFYIGSQPHIVSATDDIYYWAVEARSILGHGGLVGAAQHLSPRFMTYTPGVQLWDWLGLTLLGQWQESTLYFMLWLLYAAFLMPFAKRITWKKAYWMPAFLLLALGLPILMNGDAYSMLRVDTALAVCLGYALLQAYQAYKQPAHAKLHLICFALALCALVLIKQVGMGWAVLAVGMLLFVFRPWKSGGGRLSDALWACVPAFGVFVSWLIFSRVQQLNGAHLNNASAQLSDILSGQWTAFAGFSAVPSVLLTIFTSTARGLGLEARWFEVPMLVWIALFLLMPLALSLWKKDSAGPLRRLSLWLTVCFVGFFLSYIASFMTLFYGEELVLDNWAFSFPLTQRYFAPFLLGTLMLFIAMGQEAFSAEKKARVRVPLVCAAAAVLLCCSWTSIYQCLSPAYQREHPAANEYMETLVVENSWVDDLEAPQDAVVLYGVASYPFKPEWLQYVIAPAKLVLTAETEMTEKAFSDLIKYNHVTHVIAMDEENPIYENGQGFAEDEWMDVWTLYTVSWEDGSPVLIY